MNQNHFCEMYYLCSTKAVEAAKTSKINEQMEFVKRAIPLMEGHERELMAFVFKQVKQTKGLTSALEKFAGINGKWVNPNKPYEISATKLMRIMALSMAFWDDEEFYERSQELRAFAISYFETHQINLRKKRK